MEGSFILWEREGERLTDRPIFVWWEFFPINFMRNGGYERIEKEGNIENRERGGRANVGNRE